MPNGKTHDKISFILLPIIVVGCWVLDVTLSNTLIISISYLFSALMFNGDLDYNTRVYNRWWIFKMVWIPYQLMFSHRSVFTHGIVIGTLIRVLYIGSIPFLVLYYSYGIDLIETIGIDNLIILLVGFELGNLSHSIPDWLT